MPTNPPDKRARHGSIYQHVLITSLLVAVLGLGSLLAVRLQVRSALLDRESAQARLYAASAVEIGLLRVKQDANWRTTWANGVWLQDKSFGGGRFTLEGIDPVDGVLSDPLCEPLVLTGIGTRGAARYKTQVTLTPVVKPLAALGTCLHASGRITVNGSRQITMVGAPLSTNGQLANSGTVDGSVEADSISPIGAIVCDGTNTIVHDASLCTCPPDGYTYVDSMSISPGSWRQVVD